MTATPGQAADWWVCDGPLPAGGQKITGPFATQELALTVRAYVEKAEGRTDLWVDDEPAAQEPHAAPELGEHEHAEWPHWAEGESYAFKAGMRVRTAPCPVPLHHGDHFQVRAPGWTCGLALAATLVNAGVIPAPGDPQPQPAPALAAAMAALTRVAASHERVMYAAAIDIRHGQPGAARRLLGDQLDGWDGPGWDGTETGTQYLERTREGA
jgi:hypothetical protein